MSNLRKFHNDVRDVCSKNGWGVWSTFNDKHKDGSRRVSYMRNGWRVPNEMKEMIRIGAQDLCTVHNIVGHVYWIESYVGGHGTADKLCIDIKAPE